MRTHNRETSNHEIKRTPEVTLRSNHHLRPAPLISALGFNMTVSRVNVGVIGVASLVEVGFLVRLEFAFGTGRLDLQWLLELMVVVLLPLLLIFLPNLIYRERNIMLPLSGATLVYLFSGVSMGFMALAMGPHGAEAAIFLGLVVQVLTAGANFLRALQIEA